MGAVLQLSDYAGTKRKAHAVARAHLAKVAASANTIEVLAAYCLVLLADPNASSTDKGVELAAVLTRASEL